ncbi:hypothetical protein emb_1c0328 [Coriobacteriaceae bacterium EMTCatB1]|nr:hypothetical protein emb_1c0328 [Coriobacteriaceae bacterium EMTCatB1]
MKSRGRPPRHARARGIIARVIARARVKRLVFSEVADV